MAELFMFKGFLFWASIVGSLAIFVMRDTIIKYVKGFFGGYFDKPKEKPEEDKKESDDE